MEPVWTPIVDGTSVGPEVIVYLGGDDVARITALWSDTEGVVVALNVPPYVVIPGLEFAQKIHQTIEELLQTPAPEPSEH